MNKRLTAMVLLAGLLAFPGTATAQDSGSGFGATAGFLLPGTIDVNGFDVDTDTSILVRLTYDSFRSETLGFGVFLNYSNVGVEGGESGTMTTFGAAIKPRWPMGDSGDRWLDIGLNIGYRTVTNDDLPDDVTGMAVNASVEYMMPLSGGQTFMIDAGFISQPAGGNEDADVTWAPILYLTAGLAF